MMMAIERCIMEWCVLEAINSIDVGTSIKKELDALMMTIGRCTMEWCSVVGTNTIDVGTSIKKKLDALMMAVARCPMEWCVAVGINSIDVGTSIKKRPNILQPAFYCSIKKRLIQIWLRRHDRDNPQRDTESSTNQPSERERTQTRDEAAEEERETIDKAMHALSSLSS